MMALTDIFRSQQLPLYWLLSVIPQSSLASTSRIPNA